MTERLRVVAVFVALGLLVLAGVGIAVDRAAQPKHPATDPHGTVLPTQRQVQLSFGMPSPSDTDGLHAKLISGTMPTTVVRATVVTDEQCQPDARRISHCLNRLRLADGSEIQVRHPHNMQAVACLAPGETITVVPAVA